MPMFMIEPSSSPNHRYQIDVYGKTIRFGSPTMDNFLIHNDQDRRRSYLNRSKGIKTKNGKITRNYVLSPNYWSRRVLWLSGEPLLGIDPKFHSLVQQQINKIKTLEQKKKIKS